MEKAYWLGRKKASMKLARNAAGSQARLIHYDLAGRYGLKALAADTQAVDLADLLSPPMPLPISAKSTRGSADDAEKG